MSTFRQSADSAEFMNHLVTLHEHSQSTWVLQPELTAVMNNAHQGKNVSLLCNTSKTVCSAAFHSEVKRTSLQEMFSKYTVLCHFEKTLTNKCRFCDGLCSMWFKRAHFNIIHCLTELTDGHQDVKQGDHKPAVSMLFSDIAKRGKVWLKLLQYNWILKTYYMTVIIMSL